MDAAASRRASSRWPSRSFRITAGGARLVAISTMASTSTGRATNTSVRQGGEGGKGGPRRRRRMAPLRPDSLGFCPRAGVPGRFAGPIAGAIAGPTPGPARRCRAVMPGRCRASSPMPGPMPGRCRAVLAMAGPVPGRLPGRCRAGAGPAARASKRARRHGSVDRPGIADARAGGGGSGMLAGGRRRARARAPRELPRDHAEPSPTGATTSAAKRPGSHPCARAARGGHVRRPRHRRGGRRRRHPGNEDLTEVIGDATLGNAFSVDQDIETATANREPARLRAQARRRQHFDVGELAPDLLRGASSRAPPSTTATGRRQGPGRYPRRR